MRKYPVTTGMLRWLRKRLDTGDADDAVRWAALTTAWFFRLRCSEYAQHPGRAADETKVAAVVAGDAPRLPALAPKPP